MATLQACQNIGMPECRINLAHLVAYLSEAPKSTRAYQAYNRAEAAAKLDPTLPVPMMVRNAPTGLMKDLGYSQGYAYNPDYMYVFFSKIPVALLLMLCNSHPVTNEYLPARFKNELFLKPEDDISDKTWDEGMLRRWEIEENGGNAWDGRNNAAISYIPNNMQ